jgi:hypothetical protein
MIDTKDETVAEAIEKAAYIARRIRDMNVAARQAVRLLGESLEDHPVQIANMSAGAEAAIVMAMCEIVVPAARAEAQARVEAKKDGETPPETVDPLWGSLMMAVRGALLSIDAALQALGVDIGLRQEDLLI